MIAHRGMHSGGFNFIILFFCLLSSSACSTHAVLQLPHTAWEPEGNDVPPTPWDPGMTRGNADD